MKIEYTKTNRGFRLINFEDTYQKKCSIGKSSVADYDAIWIGIVDAEPKIMACDTPKGGVGWVPYEIPENVLLHTQMHLNRKQVKALIPILKAFVKTGELPDE